MSIPTEALLIPIPDVEDFPTDDALRFGKLRTVLRSFDDVFGLAFVVLNPLVMSKIFFLLIAISVN